MQSLQHAQAGSVCSTRRAQAGLSPVFLYLLAPKGTSWPSSLHDQPPETPAQHSPDPTASPRAHRAGLRGLLVPSAEPGAPRLGDAAGRQPLATTSPASVAPGSHLFFWWFFFVCFSPGLLLLSCLVAGQLGAPVRRAPEIQPVPPSWQLRVDGIIPCVGGSVAVASS